MGRKDTQPISPPPPKKEKFKMQFIEIRLMLSLKIIWGEKTPPPQKKKNKIKKKCRSMKFHASPKNIIEHTFFSSRL